MRTYFAAIALAVALLAPASAQEAGEEIVVTGYRAAARAAVYQELPLPAVSLTRRADSVIVDVRVSSDSRDAEVRRAEIERTLRALAARARSGDVALALQQDDTLRLFSVELAMRLLAGSGRPDTSQVLVIARTSVRDDDTLDTTRQRFQAFVGGVRGDGRALVEIAGDFGLSLRDIPQYRGPLIDAITTDARQIAERLGPDYRANVTGLESPVAWRKSGDLSLTLFISYQLNVASRG